MNQDEDKKGEGSPEWDEEVEHFTRVVHSFLEYGPIAKSEVERTWNHASRLSPEAIAKLPPKSIEKRCLSLRTGAMGNAVFFEQVSHFVVHSSCRRAVVVCVVAKQAPLVSPCLSSEWVVVGGDAPAFQVAGGRCATAIVTDRSRGPSVANAARSACASARRGAASRRGAPSVVARRSSRIRTASGRSTR